MPWAAPKPCAHVPCSKLTNKRYCSDHEALHPVNDAKAAFDAQRASSGARGYGRRWQKTRMRILRRDAVCKIRVKCKDALALSTDADHIIPKSEGGTDDDSNLQGACHACHSWKTATQDSAFARKGNRIAKPPGRG